MNLGALESMVLAIRSQAAATVTQCDSLLHLIQGDEAETSTCKHKNRHNLTTMGQPEEWKCRDCGLHWKAGAPVEGNS